MIKSFLTIIFSVIFLFSFEQGNKKSDSFHADEAVIKVTLLGTGTPQPIMDRFGPSTLVQAGNVNLVFDAGRGCLQRLRQLKLDYDKLDALFFTHLHSDHIVGLPDLWLTGWLITLRNVPLKVFGPAGCKQMTDYLSKAYAYDIKIRIEDNYAPMHGSELLTTEIKQGVVYEKDGVKVIAFLVDHFPVVPAFGYRIEYKGRSVVLSGDTKYSENLIRYAKGTDLLVHEVAISPGTLDKTDPKYHIMALHTNPEQAAKIFNLVKPKLAVFYHLVRLYGSTTEEIMKRAKAGYQGPLVLGEDLMSFSVGDSITVRKWQGN
ncbi:MAG: MBL fold metallo-hydrolase [Ginsengibacter sp.]